MKKFCTIELYTNGPLNPEDKFDILEVIKDDLRETGYVFSHLQVEAQIRYEVETLDTIVFGEK